MPASGGLFLRFVTTRREEPAVENPYQSPETPLPPPPLRTGMPPSVVTAVIALLVLFGVQAVLAVLAFASDRFSQEDVLPRAVAQVAVGGLILWGTIAGHRLAWQWGRILTIIVAVLMTIVLFGVLADIRRDEATAIVAVVFLLQVMPLYVVFFAFGRPSARVFFRLICPECRRATRRADDFFFNRARCTYCNNVW
jgi:hypothetical protein